METEKIELTKGEWKANFGEESLLIGEDNINIARFHNLDIPYEERWGNLLIASLSKAMLVRINQVSKILDSYIERNEDFAGLKPQHFQRVFQSRMEFLYLMLQSVLPIAARDDFNTPVEDSTFILKYLEHVYHQLSPKDKIAFKKQIRETLK